MRSNLIEQRRPRRSLANRAAISGLLGVAVASTAFAFTATPSAAEPTVVTQDWVCHSPQEGKYVKTGAGDGHAGHERDIFPPNLVGKEDSDSWKFGKNWPSDSIYFGEVGKTGPCGEDNPVDPPDTSTWITIGGSYVCHQVGGYNDGTWDLTWAITNASKPGKAALVVKSDLGGTLADVIPPLAIPADAKADVTKNVTSSGTQNLNVIVDFSDPGKGPDGKSFSGSYDIPVDTCAKQTPPTSTPTSTPSVVPTPGVVADTTAAIVAATPTVTAEPTPTASAIITPQPATSPTPEPVVITPEPATAPTAINAGGGSSAPEQGPRMWALALAAAAALGAAGSSIRLATSKKD